MGGGPRASRAATRAASAGTRGQGVNGVGGGTHGTLSPSWWGCPHRDAALRKAPSPEDGVLDNFLNCLNFLNCVPTPGQWTKSHKKNPKTVCGGTAPVLGVSWGAPGKRLPCAKEGDVPEDWGGGHGVKAALPSPGGAPGVSGLTLCLGHRREKLSSVSKQPARRKGRVRGGPRAAAGTQPPPRHHFHEDLG